MSHQNIENYELPTSLHATKGMFLYVGVFVIAGFSLAVYGLTYSAMIGATTLLIGNFVYWFNKDQKRYLNYRNAFVSQLEQHPISQIEEKLQSVKLGTETERFISSYLRQKREGTRRSNEMAKKLNLYP